MYIVQETSLSEKQSAEASKVH